MSRIIVMPSIFASDFFNLSEALKLIETSGADAIHYDIMDNHFVPNISFGAKVASDIVSRTKLPSFFHFMIDLGREPANTLKEFLSLRIDYFTFHIENESDILSNYLTYFKKKNRKIGFSIKPSTPVDVLLPYLDFLDLILVMSVEPGFSGQSFMNDALKRIEAVKKIIEERDIIIQVDGGINRKNYRNVLKAGANSLVIGASFYEDKNLKEWIEEIKNFSY
ncbi:MAG: ribulose-phosphate 3-epimerase [Brevinematia bacterium]